MESFPSRKNYEELADVICFSAFYTMNLALWFIIPGVHRLLLALNYVLFLVIWAVLVKYGLTREVLLEILFFALGCWYIFSVSEIVDSASRAYFSICTVLGSVFVIIGVAGAICVCYSNMKRKDDTNNQRFMVIMNNSTILFVNGYAILGYLCVKQADHGSKILGAVLLGVLGLVSLICCVTRLVSRWREYHTSGARVSDSVDVT